MESSNQKTKKDASTFLIGGAIFLIADAIVWWQIIAGVPAHGTRAYFLDVGQGDGEVVVLPGGVKVMTDAGPDSKVVRSLESVLPAGERYIDLAFVSHPQLDHFNGYNDLLDHFSFGAFIVNGRNDTPGVAQWDALVAKIKAHHVPLIALTGGDRIRYGSSTVDILSPTAEWIESGELNDTGFVERITTPDLRVLLMADTGMNIEDDLLKRGEDVHADVLKVGHHGSKYSSGDAFLAAVDPLIAVISVGANNRYGHPSPETLARFASSTAARVFRTDQSGTVRIVAEKGKLKVYTGKSSAFTLPAPLPSREGKL